MTRRRMVLHEFRAEEPVAERTQGAPRGRPRKPSKGFPAAVQRVVDDELDRLRADIEARRNPAQADTEDFFGRTFGPLEKAKMKMQTLRHDFAIRHQLLEGALPTPVVCEMLDVSAQTPNDRREAGTLLGIKDNGVWKYPEWQFDMGGPDGVVEGLPEVIRALRMGPLGKMRWLSEPHDLFGRAPIEELRRGDKARVIYEAERTNAE